MTEITNSRPSIGVSRSRAARIVSSHPETIRYYEKIGLIPPPQRDRSGYRQYDEASLSRLSFIVKLRALGFTVEDIRMLLDDGPERGLTCRSVSEIATRHLESVRQKIGELAKLETVLVELLSECSRENVTECQFVDRLIAAERQGEATR
ncbi:MerR family transcriptional regulator [Hyphobacterium sp.]|uniref:MerR family transcriptional regulator n=1 Tax=Hyphobacterium sp. TaxID=2004662 RepID=UPI003B51AE52